MRLSASLNHSPATSGALRDEMAVRRDGIDQRQVLVAAHLVILGAERGRDVDEPGTVFDGDVIGARDPPAVFRVVDAAHAEQGFVTAADEVAALVALEDLELAVQHRQARLGEQQALVAQAHGDVVDVRPGGERDVRDQRPRGGRPGEEAEILLVA